MDSVQSGKGLTGNLKDGLGAVSVGDVQRVCGVVHDEAAILDCIRHQLLRSQWVFSADTEPRRLSLHGLAAANRSGPTARAKFIPEAPCTLTRLESVGSPDTKRWFEVGHS